MTLLSCRTRRRRLYSRLSGFAPAAAAAAAAQDDSTSATAAAARRDWESSGVSGDSGVDRTAQSEVQRPPSIRGQMMEILKPDLPRVSERVHDCHLENWATSCP